MLSIDPKVDEILKSMEKDSASQKNENKINNDIIYLNDECEDFEEGYSDDEMFTSTDTNDKKAEINTQVIFKTWILDICFKNMGWLFKDNETIVSTLLIN